jgi:tripartite-type tricarboxylate transporter receptor subunit TctC
VQRLSGALVTAALIAGGTLAHAQGAASYPSKPITLILPFTAGSASDREVRVYQENFGAGFKGGSLLIDYKPGAGGIIANSYVARQPHDGYTIAYASATINILPAVRADLPYDYLKDLEPVTMTTRRVVVLVVNPSFPARNISEYIAEAKANPSKVTWATAGQGGALHLTGEWFASLAGIKLNFIHYKGLAAAEVDLIAGRLDSEPVALSGIQGQIKAGKVRPLAILSNERSSAVPGLRTVEEEGPAFSGFGYPSWVGIFTTGGTPRDIVEKLHQGFGKIIRTPDAMKVWEQQGTVPVGLAPDEYRKQLIFEESVWRKLIKQNNITVE